MNFLLYFYHIFLLVVSWSTLFFAVYAARYRHLRTAQFFFWLMLAVTGWQWADLIRAIGQSVPLANILESKVQYVFIAAIPVLFFLFILDYMGYEKWTTPKTIVVLFIIPAITQIINWVGLNGGVEKDIIFTQTDGFIYSVGWTYTSWFWVHMAYSYVLLLLAIALIIANLLQSSQAYRHRIIYLLIGSLLPLVASVLDTFNMAGGPIDFTPIGFAFMGPFFLGALFRHRLLDLIPVARSKLVETMNDPMLVIDSLGRIVDLNQAAQSIFNIPGKKAIGRHAERVLTGWQDLIGSYKHPNHANEEITVVVGKEQRSFDLQISALTDRKARITGRLIVFRDITARKEAEQERERLIGDLQKALADVKTLSGLLPICAACKKIRDDKGYWNQLEAYILEYAEVKFSHGLCPECARKLYPDL